MPPKPSKKTPSQGEGKKVLLYSASQDSLKDYSETLDRIGVSHDIVNNIKDAKKMLLSGAFDMLQADVTDFESSGHRIIHWAQNHLSDDPQFKTHGYTRTDVPSTYKHIYSRGSDQRFYFDHVDIDRLTELMSSLFINRKDIRWVNEMRDAQRRLRKGIGTTPPTLCPVLLNGAKGLGKECLAQIVHCMCDRRPNKFVVLDCNPRQRFEYAYEPSIDNHKNREAIRKNLEIMLGNGQGGTVFFRSFTHLSKMAQEVLYEVLMKGYCILPESGGRAKFEGRIIFSSNKNLSDLVQENKLDERLYGMLCRNALEIKPLAMYPDDLVPLAEAMADFLCIKARGKTMKFLDNAKKLIRSYPWGGNLVQMYEVIQLAVSIASDLKIRERDLSIKRIEPLDEKSELERLLKKHNYNISQVSNEMDRSRPYVYDRLKKHGLWPLPKESEDSEEEKMDA